MSPKKQSVPRAQPSLPNVPPPEMGTVRKSRPKAHPKPAEQGGDGELFIVDNGDENWKVGNYLRELFVNDLPVQLNNCHPGTC